MDKKYYLNKLSDQIKQWEAEIDKLKAKADKTKADVKIEYNKKIDEIRHKKEVVEKKFKVLHESSDEAWDEIKDGLEKSWKEFKNSLDSVISKFKS